MSERRPPPVKIAAKPTTAKPAQTPERTQQQRRKNWAPKVRTGCITCRTRRVKCDETKPVCKRCVAAKRNCDGYAYQVRPTWLETPLPRLVFHGLTPLYELSSSREKEIFSLFCTQTARQVAGAFDTSFWSTDILRAAQNHAAIWHATLAMTAMHVYGKLADDSATSQHRQEYYAFALTQYNMSISHLVRLVPRADLSRRDQAVVLTTSALFIGLCSLRGDPKEAMLHVRQGLRLISQWKRAKGNGVCMDKKNDILPTVPLHALFDRLEVQYLWTGAREPLRQRDTGSSQLAVLPQFTTLVEASSKLQLLINSILLGVRTEKLFRAGLQTLPPLDKHHMHKLSLSAWKKNLDHLKRSQSLEEADLHCILILEMWYTGAEIAANLDISRYEMAWDDFTTKFKNIVDLADQLLKRPPAKDEQSDWPVFSFAPSVCEPLFMVGSSCRDTRIRREAISLLRKWPRREGTWDSRLLAAVAEAKMVLEESGSKHGRERQFPECNCTRDTVICCGHRVLALDIEFVEEGGAQVVMKTLNDAAQKRPGHTFLLSKGAYT